MTTMATLDRRLQCACFVILHIILCLCGYWGWPHWTGGPLYPGGHKGRFDCSYIMMYTHLTVLGFFVVVKSYQTKKSCGTMFFKSFCVHHYTSLYISPVKSWALCMCRLLPIMVMCTLKAGIHFWKMSENASILCIMHYTVEFFFKIISLI